MAAALLPTSGYSRKVHARQKLPRLKYTFYVLSLVFFCGMAYNFVHGNGDAAAAGQGRSLMSASGNYDGVCEQPWDKYVYISIYACLSSVIAGMTPMLFVLTSWAVADSSSVFPWFLFTSVA